ncbi:MAG TPA: hypothetical protein VNN07_17400, partial [Candidatus Tectomicrobia bacterium]|nr:hypothetical protein [Candidatus Tectomicrobia bacterium]
MSRGRHVLAVVALLALLALGQLVATTAELGILWRALALSWDAPATQLQDEKAVAASDRELRSVRDAVTRLAPSARLPVVHVAPAPP